MASNSASTFDTLGCQVMFCLTCRFAEEDRRQSEQPADDAFTDSDPDRPAWVQRYLDLADLALKRTEDEEENEEDHPTPSVA
jgi:hypothetical protein